jgi:hypothetical protein
MAAHVANFAMRLRTLEQYEGLKPEHYPYNLLLDTWKSSVNASFFSEVPFFIDPEAHCSKEYHRCCQALGLQRI